MGNVPRELEQPPPRDPAQGKDVYAASNIALVGASIAAGAIMPAIIVGNWRFGRAFDPLDASMIFAYGWTIVASIVLVLVVLRWLRVRSVYRDGIVTEASIETVRLEPIGPGRSRAIMDLRWGTADREHRRRITIVGVLDDTVVRAGGTVVLLVLPDDPERIGVYTPRTGLVLPSR